MEDFPSNSHEATKPGDQVEPPKKIDKVTTGEVVRRKKPLGKRLADTFIGGDAKSVWNYVLIDVAIPAAKDMIADAISTGIERMLFGEGRSPSRRVGGRPSSSHGYVSYNRYSQPGARREDPRGPALSRRNRATHNFDEIILKSRQEAETVIDNLFNLISQYEQATVADLYELVGITASYTDEKYGWTDFRGAGVTRVRNGYLLDLPRTELLE